MPLKVYYDLMSQPSRALVIFLENCKIPYDKCPVALRNGEHLTDKYKSEISRFQKVPAVIHNGFKLSESIAIIRYLAREFQIDNNWYPKEIKSKARVDEFLEWQHIRLRAPCAMYFQSRLRGQDYTKIQDRMITAVDNFESLWLNDGLYVAGNIISVADIFAACELEQPRFFGYNLAEGRPILARWWANVRNAPHYEEIHSVFNRLAAKMAKM